MKRTIRLHWMATVWLLGVFVMDLQAQTCMVSPTDKGVVSGRFGKIRGGGAANFGSANTQWHVHDGLDFSTDLMSLPVYATSDGVVTHRGMLGTAGNAILLRRDNGDVVAYYHLGGFEPGVGVGSRVRAGQKIGISGNTPAATMAKHLHLSYGSASQQDARAAAFQGEQNRSAGGPFRPEVLQYAFRQNHLGWRTDPSPYFCQTFPINDGHPEHYPILGRDSKAQHSIMFGGGSADAQAMAAEFDVLRSGASPQNPEAALKDGEAFGMPALAPIGEYDAMSVSEMMRTEAWKRFSDADWDQDVRKLSIRALWVDYNKAMAFGNFMQREIDRKKERIEALLATFTLQRLQRLQGMHEVVNAGQARAALAGNKRAIDNVIRENSDGNQ